MATIDVIIGIKTPLNERVTMVITINATMIAIIIRRDISVLMY